MPKLLGRVQIPDAALAQGVLLGSDVNLYRDSANVLRTDDLFAAGLGFVVPRVSQFPVPPVAVDGMTVDIQSTEMSVQGIRWRCVYDAARDRWTVVGGVALNTTDDSSFATSSTTYVESGPNVDLPYPGVYDITVEGHLITPAVATGATFLSPQLGSIAASDPPAAYQNTQTANAGQATVNKTTRFGPLTSAQLAVKSMMRCSGGSGSSIRRRIWARPVWITNP